MIEINLFDEAATDALGAILAAHLVPRDVVTLQGPLGSGKTALARAIIRARLGDPDLEVPSPSFALLQPYDGIVHADLYRLNDEGEIFELGLLDDDDAILLVEWPQRAPILFDRDGIKITIEMEGKRRRAAIRPQGARALSDLFAALAQAGGAAPH